MSRRGIGHCRPVSRLTALTTSTADGGESIAGIRLQSLRTAGVSPWVSAHPRAYARGSLLLVDRHDRPHLRPDVTRPRANQPIVRELFNHVRRPPGNAARDEDWRVDRYLKAERVIKPSGRP